MSGVKIAVVFDMLGPYHFARLNKLGLKESVVGIEVSAKSKIYAWDRVNDDASFERRTLFDVDVAETKSNGQVAGALFSELDLFDPDVVFVPGWRTPAALASLGWSLKNKRPTVLMSESTSTDQRRTTIREAIKRQIVKCFTVAFVGGEPHKRYLYQLGMDQSRIETGYNSVDNEYFEAGAAYARRNKIKIRKELDLPARYVLASARFIGIKNVPTLLEAFAAFLANNLNSDLSLVILGDGSDREIIEAKRRKLGLENAVVLPGFKQYGDLPKYYGLAEAFIHVSRIEPWGLVVNEAMASGLPVIVSRECGCASSLVEHEGNGFVADHDDVDAISLSLSRLEADQDLRNRMGARSLDLISNFSPDEFAKGALTAAEKAISIGAREPTFLQKSILNAVAKIA